MENTEKLVLGKRPRIAGIVTAILSIQGASIYMFLNPLWSYAPLFLLLGLWFLIVFTFYPRWYGGPLGLRRFLLSTLSGILLALPFLSPVAVPLILLAFVPLFLEFHRRIGTGGKGQLKGFLWDAYHCFVVWNILSTFWVANSALAPAIFAIWVNSALMLLPIILMYIAYRKLSARLRWAALLAPWLCFEFLHMNWQLSWPWLNLGNALALLPSLAQWYEYTGALGGSLWILLCNHLIAIFLLRHSWQMPSFLKEKSMWIIVLLPMLISLVIYATYERETDAAIDCAAIQLNYEPHYEKFSVTEAEQLKRITGLMDSVAQTGNKAPDYFILPETVIANVNTDSPFAKKEMKELKAFLNKYPQSHLITGVSAYTFQDTMTEYGRLMPNGGYYERMNYALEMGGNRMYGGYAKSKFVPGAESFPYKKILFFLKPLVDALGGSTAGNKPQPEREVFDAGKASLAPIICYESIYGDYCTDYVRKGADLLVVMTNDGWWDDTPGHRQHMHYASLRAIENRRPVLRAANTGISCFINPLGQITDRTAYEETIAIRKSIGIASNKKLTFYSRWGDLIGRAALFVSLILLMQVFVSLFKPENSG